MEYLYLGLFLGVFAYIFGYLGRYCYGTRMILHTEAGYSVITWWGRTELAQEEIEKEVDMGYGDLLSFAFDYNPFRIRSYILFPPDRFRIVTLRSGFLRYHIMPVDKITEKRSNQLARTTPVSAPR